MGPPSRLRLRRVLPALLLLVLMTASVAFVPALARSVTLATPAPPLAGHGFASLRDGPRLPSSPARAVTGYVNPYLFETSEPAAMGIADYGVSGTVGVVRPYSYATPEFQGNVAISSMLTSIPGSTQHYMTFQLNVVAVFTLGGTNYSYWIQDIASIESSTRYTGWIDNIWNLSSSTGGFATAGELSGNGSVGTLSNGQTWYADSPGATYPGSLVTLTYPTNVTIRVVASTVNGYPHVGFEYDDGYGWVTYDNVSFLHLRNAVNHGFVVDGYRYTPLGIFYDAEWDFTGAGAGNHNVESQLNMTLDYWNGHNLAAIPGAFNFGSDTGESLDNTVAGLAPSPPDGTLAAWVTNGSGTLHPLYNASTTSVLNISTPTVAAGTVTIGGTPVAFRGNDANLTLAPGTYPIGLWDGFVPVDSTNVTLAAGTYTALVLPLPRFEVRFVETGLPAGTNWSVAIGASVASSTNSTVALSEKAGGYTYRVTPVPGFVPDAYSGPLAVVAGDVVINVTFAPFNFTAIFNVIGLPDGTPWAVEVAGATVGFTAPSGSVALPNGTYAYNVTTVNAYLASPPNGTFTVAGSDVGVDLSFVIHLGAIAGSVTPASALLSVDGGSTPLAGGAFNLSEPPGTYHIEATADGFVAAWHNVTVTPGNTSWANFSLTALPSAGPSPGGTPSILASPWLYVAIAAVGAAAIAGAGYAYRRRATR